MKREITKRLSIVIAVTMLFVLAVNLFLQVESARENMEQSARMTIHRIEEILESNDADYLRLTESLKEGYIVRAKAAAYMLSNMPEIGRDSDEMMTLAELLQVDEICLFDEDGVLYGGSHPEYYGYSLYSGEQISYFLPMLDDKKLEMCQDVTPNTALGEPMIYAAVWEEDGSCIVQVGLSPQRVLEAGEKNETGYIFSKLAVQEGFLAIAVNAKSGEIVGTTEQNLSGQNAENAGIVFPTDGRDFCYVRVGGEPGYCVFHEYGGLLIGVIWKNSVLYADLAQSMLLVMLYFSVAAVVMIAAILRSMDSLVIDSVNTVNENLDEIIRGNLDTKVSVETVPEFVSLSAHINQMTESLLNTTVKISRILDATDAQIGFFEYSAEGGGVLATRKVATILMIPPDEMKELTADKDLFRARIDEICSNAVLQGKNIYSMPTETACYVKIETFSEGSGIFGIVMDVTEEILDKERIRHERDHDLLTQLRSRRAFYKKLDELYAAPDKLGLCAIMMFDLDGLKTINDTCGHAGGDKAIREAANILGSIHTEKKVVARLSGDEFSVFLYGAKDREELQMYVDALYTTMLGSEITVFDHTVPVRLSGGYVFCCDHDSGYNELLRMADQALYHSKRTGKAKFTEFRPELADEGK